jgi:hypothetical protein
MINIQDAIHVHEVLIDKFGGIKGVRDTALLESALSRPFKHLIKRIYILLLLISQQL